jgi:hypothetical protein
MQSEYRPGTFREKLFGDGPYLPERHVGRSYKYQASRKDRHDSAIKQKSAVS